MYLYLLIEYVSTGFKTIFLFFLSLISIYFAIMTVIALNPVISVLYLIGLFVAIALYLMALGLDFLGLSYLLVYVGAISILFIFILMLINVRVSELLTEGINGATLAVIAIITFSFNVTSVLPYYLQISDAFSNYLIYIHENISYALSRYLMNAANKLSSIKTALVESANVNGKSWDGSLIEINHISSIGNILYSKLYIYLILISFILLLAMVGTIVITLKRETNLKHINLEASVFTSLIEACNNLIETSSSNIFDISSASFSPIHSELVRNAIDASQQLIDKAELIRNFTNLMDVETSNNVIPQKDANITCGFSKDILANAANNTKQTTSDLIARSGAKPDLKNSAEAMYNSVDQVMKELNK